MNVLDEVQKNERTKEILSSVNLGDVGDMANHPLVDVECRAIKNGLLRWKTRDGVEVMGSFRDVPEEIRNSAPMGLPGPDGSTAFIKVELKIEEGLHIGRQVDTWGRLGRWVALRTDEWYALTDAIKVGAVYAMQNVPSLLLGEWNVFDVEAPSKNMAITQVWTNASTSKCTLDLFCGIGGWEHGAKRCSTEEAKGTICVGVDICREALVTMQRNFGGVILTESQLLNYLKEKRGVINENVFLWADVRSLKWRAMLAITPAVEVRMSPPCVSWSNAGNRAGLASATGDLFVKSCELVSIIQPVQCFIENVAAIKTHDHWKEVEKAMRQIGMWGPFTTRADLKLVTANCRNRFLAIMMRYEPKVFNFWERWPTLTHLVRDLEERRLDHKATCLEEVKITDDVIKILKDCKLLPKNIRAQWGTLRVPERIVENVRFPSDQTTPCFMHSYTKQHELPGLGDKGLLAFGIKTETGARYYHQCEIANELAFEPNAVWPRDLTTAAAQLGNSVSPAHAAYAYHAATVAHGRSTVSHEEMLKNHFFPRPNLQKCEAWSSDQWVTLVNRQEPESEAFEIQIHVGHCHVFTRIATGEETYAQVLQRTLPAYLWSKVDAVFEIGEDRDRKTDMANRIASQHIRVTYAPMPLTLQNGTRLPVHPLETVAETRAKISKELGWPLAEVRLWIGKLLPVDDTRMYAFAGEQVYVQRLKKGDKQPALDCQKGEERHASAPSDLRCQSRTPRRENADIRAYGTTDLREEDAKTLAYATPRISDAARLNQVMLHFGGHPPVRSETTRCHNIHGGTNTYTRWRIGLCEELTTWCAQDEIAMLMREIAFETGRSIAEPLVWNQVQGMLRKPDNLAPTPMPRDQRHKEAYPICADGHWIVVLPTYHEEHIHVRVIGQDPAECNALVDALLDMIGRDTQNVRAIVQVPSADMPHWCGYTSVIALRRHWRASTHPSWVRTEDSYADLVHSGHMDDHMQNAINAFVRQAKRECCQEVVAFAYAARMVCAGDVCLNPPLAFGGANKIEGQRKIVNELALNAIRAGIELTQATLLANSLVRAVAREKIDQTLAIPSESVRLEEIRRLAEHAKITWPKQTSLPTKGKGKGKSKAKGKVERQYRANQFVLKLDRFTNEDGTQCAQLKQMAPRATGVVLMDPHEAEPWIRDNVAHSVEELAIIVLGPNCPIAPTPQCHPVTVPAIGSDGHPVLVKGCMHQVGGKAVKIHSGDQKIQVHDTYVIAISCYADELTETEWATVVKSPVRATLDLLAVPSEERSFQGPPWGRTWSDGRRQTTQDTAISLQYHVRVTQEHLKAYMCASGTKGTYVTLRDQNTPHAGEYSIIWMKGTAVEIMAQLSQNIDHYGVVRAMRKGDKASRGVRVRTRDFSKIFQQLRPQEDIPDVRPVIWMGKISPTPKGASAKDVAEWIQQQNWQARPIRALNSSVWLIGFTHEMRPEAFTTWNDAPILLQELRPRRQPLEQTIIAGRPPTGAQDNPREPDDPWAAYLKRTGAANNMPPSAQVAKRAVEAPLEDRFKQHQSQIDELRQNITALTDQVQQGQHKIACEHKELKKEVSQLQGTVQEQIQQATKSFEESVSKALKRQENTQEKRFEQLIEMLQGNQTGPSPPRKKERAEGQI